jgi:hypothetical protein
MAETHNLGTEFSRDFRIHPAEKAFREASLREKGCKENSRDGNDVLLP